MKKLIYLFLVLPLLFSSCAKERGCTDSQASNYNGDAEEDGGRGVTKVLFIDNRERSGLEDLVKKYIDKTDGLFHQTKQNMIADYAFNSVGIEAKSIQDYMGSMMSGHLEQQLQNLGHD